MVSKPAIQSASFSKSRPDPHSKPCKGHADTYVFLDDNITGNSRFYENPLKIITAHSAAQIAPAMAAIDDAIANGYHVAGYASYELGLYLDARLERLRGKASKNQTAPLLCFGVFKTYCAKTRPAKTRIKTEAVTPLPKLTPQWSEADYGARFTRLLDYIRAGDIYQANLTFAYSGHTDTAPDLPYLQAALRGRQPVRYGGIIKLCAPDILSLSPELFFKIKDGKISARPMKGTAARAPDKAADTAIGAALIADEKSRAENLMIVDLLRNDIARISEVGSVNVTDLFTLETFPTLHQMTSGIEAVLKPDIKPSGIFAALFPCGSVTGAPKIRAMEIISELEDAPRGPYCGSMGYFDPNGSSAFNVAIRTLVSTPDEDGGAHLAYHVGSGVVYDSSRAAEYQECQLKAQILTSAPSQPKPSPPKPSPPERPAQNVIETLLWTPDSGFAYLEGHMVRLLRSAQALNLRADIDLIAAQRALDDAVQGCLRPMRVRLSLALGTGQITISQTPLGITPDPLALRVCKERLDSTDASLRFKTSPSALYDKHRARLKDIENCDELIFLNENADVCEGSFTNIFAQIDGQLYTPPLSCGLLPGVLRAHMLGAGEVKPRTLKLADLMRAEAIFAGNSVRGLCRATLNNTDEV